MCQWLWTNPFACRRNSSQSMHIDNLESRHCICANEPWRPVTDIVWKCPCCYGSWCKIWHWQCQRLNEVYSTLWKPIAKPAASSASFACHFTQMNVPFPYRVHPRRDGRLSRPAWLVMYYDIHEIQLLTTPGVG